MNTGASSSRADAPGGRDDDGPSVLDRVFELLARRRLEERNNQLQQRLGDGGRRIPMSGPRADRWITTAAEIEREILGRRARDYLDFDPSLSPDDLAEVLWGEAVPAGGVA
jgi:hypothetical protein